MKTKKDKISIIFNESFSENPTWNKWFFEKVYDEEEAMLLIRGGNAVSTLMLQHYFFNFCGHSVPLAYIFGAATASVARGKGCMTELMSTALNQAYERGDSFAALIPAHHSLYFFYDKFGFATTVYYDTMRYTSAHIFEMDASMRPVTPTYELMSRLEREELNTVRHTREQFLNIMEDMEHDGGTVAAVEDAENVGRAAMVFMAPSSAGTEYVVRAVMGKDETAIESAIAVALCGRPELPVSIHAHPHRQDVLLTAHAMMRVINVKDVLSRVAVLKPDVNQVIRVHDSIIAANNGVYVMHDGTCEQVDATMRRLTLDVSVSTLTAILFSCPKVGQIFGLPTERASLPLMLD